MIVAMQKDARLLSSSQPISPHLFLFIYLLIFLNKFFHYTVFSACLLHKLLLIFIFSSSN